MIIKQMFTAEFGATITVTTFKWITGEMTKETAT